MGSLLSVSKPTVPQKTFLMSKLLLWPHHHQTPDLVASLGRGTGGGTAFPQPSGSLGAEQITWTARAQGLPGSPRRDRCPTPGAGRSQELSQHGAAPSREAPARRGSRGLCPTAGSAAGPSVPLGRRRRPPTAWATGLTGKKGGRQATSPSRARTPGSCEEQKGQGAARTRGGSPTQLNLLRDSPRPCVRKREKQ